jgi:hypothetical protein
MKTINNTPDRLIAISAKCDGGKKNFFTFEVFSHSGGFYIAPDNSHFHNIIFYDDLKGFGKVHDHLFGLYRNEKPDTIIKCLEITDEKLIKGVKRVFVDEEEFEIPFKDLKKTRYTISMNKDKTEYFHKKKGSKILK